MTDQTNKLSKSQLKTWLRMNGFKPRMTYKGFRSPMREVFTSYAVERNGRLFRIRMCAGCVDIGKTKETFDRWANSTERIISIQEFLIEYRK